MEKIKKIKDKYLYQSKYGIFKWNIYVLVNPGANV